MTSEVMCPCGIAKVDCDYHKPEQQDYIIGPVIKQVEFTYQGKGIWLSDVPVQDNPFKTNDMSKRARFMLHHRKMMEDMLEKSDRGSQLREVRRQIEEWCSHYLDVIVDTTKDTKNDS